MRLKRSYSSREAAAYTGLSARQLQLWDEAGLLPSAVRPHRTEAGGYTERRYTPIDLFELRVLAELRYRGFSVQQLHELQRILKVQFGTRLFDATGGGPLQLLTDDTDVYARTDHGEVFSLLKSPIQPLLAVGETDRLRELSGRLRPRRSRRKKAGAPDAS
jgi:DNA-binding transcriptional MerR regulator